MLLIQTTENALGDANQSVHLVAGEGLEAYLPLADMVDISAEVQRLSKRISKMQTEYDGLVARLNSPKVCITTDLWDLVPSSDSKSYIMHNIITVKQRCLKLSYPVYAYRLTLPIYVQHWVGNSYNLC